MTTPDNTTPTTENDHHVRYTNYGGRDGTVLIEHGPDRRRQALDQAAGIRASGGTVHDITEITPQGPRTVDEPPPTLSPQHELADQIAAALGTDLGHGWTARPDHDDRHHFTLHGPDDMQVGIDIGAADYMPAKLRDRLHAELRLDPELDRLRPPSMPRPTMSASLAKSPSLLATDLKRRVITPGKAVLATTRTALLARQDRQAHRDQLADHAATILGPDAERTASHLTVGDSTQPVHVRIDMAHRPDTARITLDLPVDAVPRAAELIAHLRSQHPPAD